MFRSREFNGNKRGISIKHSFFVVTFFCLAILFHNKALSFEKFILHDVSTDTGSKVIDLRILNDDYIPYIFALLENGNVRIYNSDDFGLNWNLLAIKVYHASSFDVSYHDPSDSYYDFDIAYISKDDDKIHVIKYKSPSSFDVYPPLDTGFNCYDVSLSWPHLAAAQSNGDVSMWRAGTGNYVKAGTTYTGWYPSISDNWVTMYIIAYPFDGIAAYPCIDGIWQINGTDIVLPMPESVRQIKMAQKDNAWIIAWQHSTQWGRINLSNGITRRTLPDSYIAPYNELFAVTANETGKYLARAIGKEIDILTSPSNSTDIGNETYFDTGWGWNVIISSLDFSSNYINNGIRSSISGDPNKLALSKDSAIRFFGKVQLYVTSPHQGEQIPIGTAMHINWYSSDYIGPFVKFELYKGGSLNKILTENWPNQVGINDVGWGISSEWETGDDYKIRVSSLVDPNWYGENEQYFSIVSKDCITMPILMDIIYQWKLGNINMVTLMQNIAKWKSGEGCN